MLHKIRSCVNHAYFWWHLRDLRDLRDFVCTVCTCTSTVICPQCGLFVHSTVTVARIWHCSALSMLAVQATVQALGDLPMLTIFCTSTVNNLNSNLFATDLSVLKQFLVATQVSNHCCRLHYSQALRLAAILLPYHYRSLHCSPAAILVATQVSNHYHSYNCSQALRLAAILVPYHHCSHHWSPAAILVSTQVTNHRCSHARGTYE